MANVRDSERNELLNTERVVSTPSEADCKKGAYKHRALRWFQNIVNVTRGLILMRSRAFLASALTTTITAGCVSVGSRTEHTDPMVEADDNPRDRAKYLEFHRDSADLATLGVDPQVDPLPRNLAISISHPEDTELQSLTQRFAAPDGDGPPPRLSLQGPFEGDHRPHPSVSLFQEGMAAVVEVHRFGEIADETVFIFLTVTRWPESARRLVVDSTVELVEMGTFDHTHVLDGELEFEFSAETEASDGTTDTPDSSEWGRQTPVSAKGQSQLVVRTCQSATGCTRAGTSIFGWSSVLRTPERVVSSTKTGRFCR